MGEKGIAQMSFKHLGSMDVYLVVIIDKVVSLGEVCAGLSRR